MLSLRSTTIPSEDEIVRWSLDNPGFRFEFVDGNTIVTPTGGKSGIRSNALNLKLGVWARKHGYRAFGSSTLFIFADVKVSPDEALLRAERFDVLSDAEQENSVKVAPDIAVEIISRSQQAGKDRIEVQRKCEAMFRAGTSFVLMLDPYTSVASERVTTWGTPPPDFPTSWDDVLNA